MTRGSSRYFWWGAILLVLYNLSTLLFTAANEGYVHDEPMYIEIGKMVLNGEKPERGWGHPPLSVWTGAWLPWKLKNYNTFAPQTLFQSRLSHIFINVAGQILLLYLLFRKRGVWAALLFGFFYSTLSVLKFVSTHHLTDSDSTVLAVSSLALLWALPPTGWVVFGSTLLVVLSTMSKVSMILVAPFVLARIHPKKSIPAVALALFIALSVTYQFHFEQFQQYFDIIKIQLTRAAGGSPNSLLGQRIDGGVWYYFLVVGFFKLPLIFTFLILGSLVLSVKFRKEKDIFYYFLLPAILIFFVFSRSTLQLGIRYITASLVLFSLFATLVWDEVLNKWPKLKPGFVLTVGLSLLILDFWTLKKSSYQTYFNFLAPRPPTQFTESNIDWHQKIPHSLEPLAPPSLFAKHYLDFLLDPGPPSATFKLTSMELNNIWGHPVGVLFRGLTPFLTLAGHEFHTVTKEELFRLLQERPPFHSAKVESFERWDKPFRFETCGEKTFGIKSFPLLDLRGFVEKIPDELPSQDKILSVEFPELRKYLVVVEGNAPIDLTLEKSQGRFPRGSLEEYRHYSFWFPYEPAQRVEKATLHFEKRFERIVNRGLETRALLLYGECH